MINIEMINAYLNEKLAKRSFSAEPILGLGFVNQVFKVAAQPQNFILRVNNEEALDAFIKERWCYEQMSKLRLPAPEILDVSSKQGACFFFMTQLPGENCITITDPALQTNVYQKLGTYAKKLSQVIPGSDIGDLKSAENAEICFQHDYLQYEIKQTSSPDDYLIISLEQRNYILKSLDLLAKTKFQFVLCHGDISLKNCLFDKKSNQIFLIDFGSAETHVKDYFEIALKWIAVYFDKTLSYADFLVFITAVIGENAEGWLEDHLSIVEALSLVYTLDNYRWAHDQHPGEEWEELYKKRFYTVLGLMA